MITVLDNFNPETDYFQEPYPHIVIKNALPKDFYQTLAKTFPTQEMKQKLPLIEGHTHRYLANDVLNKKTITVSEEWQDFFKAHTSQKYYDKVLNLFKNDITYGEQVFNKKVMVRGVDEKKW